MAVDGWSGPTAESASAGSPLLTAPGAPAAFHMMAKPTGAVCNLDCEYCFFLSKEMLYPGSRFRMARRAAGNLHPPAAGGARRAPEVMVAWQGGEPTMMGVDFFRRAVELGGPTPAGPAVLNTIQTNGTLLDDEWAESSRAPSSWWHLDRRPGRRCTTPTGSTRGASRPSTG